MPRAAARAIRLADGELLHFVLVTGAAAPQLIAVCHHLVVDAVSWGILVADLLSAYTGGPDAPLPAKTSSFKVWAVALTERAMRLDAAEIDYWTAVSAGDWRMPRDRPSGANTTLSTREIRTALTREETAALDRRAAARHRGRIEEVLLTALTAALERWAAAEEVVIDIESHGREAVDSLDVSRTVGWFTTIHPVALPVSGPESHDARLREVKRRLRAVPNGGAGYGLLRYLRADEVIPRMREARTSVLFNYLGRAWNALGEHPLIAASNAVAKPVGLIRDGLRERAYLLEVQAGSFDGRLELTIGYSHRVHDEETIASLARHMMAVLRHFVSEDHAVRSGHTAVDFPAANLPNGDLAAFLARLA